MTNAIREHFRPIMSPTEGEWKRDGLRVSSFGHGVIAVCPTPQNGGVMECTANARLIAVAKEMFAALDATTKNLRTLERALRDSDPKLADIIAVNATGNEQTLVKAGA